MQLVFTVEEFRVLVDILLGSEREEVRRGQHDCPASSLIQKALAHDFCFGIDELENLEDILKVHAAKLTLEVQECQDESSRAELQRKQKLLEHLMDRVTEACAMA